MSSDAASPAAPAPAAVTSSRILAARPTKVCVFGSGSFGTALGIVLARNGLEVVLLTRRPEVAAAVCAEHRNPAAFSSHSLPFCLGATTDAAAALRGASFIVHSIPVQASFEYLRELAPHVPAGVPIINSSKGVHLAKGMFMSELVPAALAEGGAPGPNPVVVFGGPTFAEELVKAFPSGAVVAAAAAEHAAAAARLFSSPTLRVFTSADVRGMEIAGALKNVYAIAAGCLVGLGLGTNSAALLVTRAVAEMAAIAKSQGCTEATLSGLSGVGDLMLTCFGAASRNRRVGERLGRGESLAAILASLPEVAEGVSTAPAALRLARAARVDAPIIEAVVAVLEGALTPLEALMALLSIPIGTEQKAAPAPPAAGGAAPGGV